MHIDSTNPFRFLLAIECPPLFAYGRLLTRALIGRRRHARRRPEGGQDEGKNSEAEHGWARGCARVGRECALFMSSMTGGRNGVTDHNTFFRCPGGCAGTPSVPALRARLLVGAVVIKKTTSDDRGCRARCVSWMSESREEEHFCLTEGQS
jgi:hypothetical protein